MKRRKYFTMLSPQELATWAYNKSLESGSFTIPEERLFVMLDLVRRYHYHILATDIELACRRKAGIELTTDISA